MERFLMQELIRWKTDENRKPMVLTGARQVGKTWLVKEFGQKYFDDTIYINFERQREFHDILENTMDPDKIIEVLSGIYNKRIDPAGTLIIFDEVQEEPRALTALKYFFEERQEYHLIATGSFMGIAMHKGTSFPVGKVDMLTLYPMNFREFLIATGKANLNKYLTDHDTDAIWIMKNIFIDALRTYYIVGGMPSAVLEYVNTHNFSEVREQQMLLLDYYRMDFSKHAEPRLAMRLNQVWDIIPAQLAKENRKFMFNKIAQGARAKDFELALEWLKDCGLIYVIHRVTKPGIPLKAYEDMGAFKVYMNDVGLLGAAGDLDPGNIINENELFAEFKGALSEQYVLSQMISDMKIFPFYYSTENSRGEIDFITVDDGHIIPIEVKSEENLRARSLRAFVDKYKDAKAVRISMSDYREESWLTNLPLYGFMSFYHS